MKHQQVESTVLDVCIMLWQKKMLVKLEMEYSQTNPIFVLLKQNNTKKDNGLRMIDKLLFIKKAKHDLRDEG